MCSLKKTVILIVSICLICLINLNYKLSLVLKNNKLQKNIKNLSNNSYITNRTKVLEFGNSKYNRSIIEDFAINTPGCYIPNYAKDLMFNKSRGSQNKNLSCGVRAIFIERRPNNGIKFRINTAKFGKYKNITKTKKFQCCYRFVSRSSIPDREDTHLRYSPCVKFKHGTVVNLNEEVVVVKCVVNNPKEYFKEIIYEDAYIILKKFNRKANSKKLTDKPWNVVVLGIDRMSRERILSTMPRTSEYLQENKWLDFRGYHKIAWKSYHNIMSLLTGNNACSLDDVECNELMIWNKFKNAGYVTAYGEDQITMTDSLSRNNFRTPPTDHYMRPFFLTGEKRNHNLICMKNIPSAKNILSYAHDFIEAYRSDAYFGFFWVNSNHDNVSLNFDYEISDFFTKLHYSKLLNNTFIIFLSTHANQYGKMRIPISSYYDERSPMFFMRTPDEFEKSNSLEYRNLQLNQMRLTTAYDIYATFVNVLNFNKSLESNLSVTCPDSTSLFEEISPHRTCSDACVNENLCICHNMVDIIHNESTNRSVQLVVSYIQNKTNSTKTIACMACEPLHLDTVLRIYMYKSEHNKPLFVVSLKMSPGNLLFQATVMDNGKGQTILKENDVYSISPYNRHGYCAISQQDRQYCLCKPSCN